MELGSVVIPGKKIRALETGWDPADAKLAVILSHHVRHT